MKVPKSAKAKAFCEYYAESEDGTQSALKAGYSEKTAGQMAYNLRQTLEVQQYIQYLLSEKEAKKRKDEERLREKSNISKEMLIAEAAKLAFADMGTFVENEDGLFRLKDFSELPEGATAAIMEISETPTPLGKNKKLKLHSKQAAITLLADLLGYKAAEKKEIIIQETAIDKTNFSIKTRAPEIE